MRGFRCSRGLGSVGREDGVLLGALSLDKDDVLMEMECSCSKDFTTASGI